MKVTKKILLAAMTLPFTLGAVNAFASGDNAHHKDHRGMHNERGIMHQLNLTDDQKSQLKSMRKANKEEMKARFNHHKEARLAERKAYDQKEQALVLADNFDKAAANQLAKEMAEKQVQRRVAMLEKKHQMLSILTPEQKAKYSELRAEKQQNCAKKFQRLMKDKTKHEQDGK